MLNAMICALCDDEIIENDEFARAEDGTGEVVHRRCLEEQGFTEQQEFWGIKSMGDVEDFDHRTYHFNIKPDNENYNF